MTRTVTSLASIPVSDPLPPKVGIKEAQEEAWASGLVAALEPLPEGVQRRVKLILNTPPVLQPFLTGRPS